MGLSSKNFIAQRHPWNSILYHWDTCKLRRRIKHWIAQIQVSGNKAQEEKQVAAWHFISTATKCFLSCCPKIRNTSWRKYLGWEKVKHFFLLLCISHVWLRAKYTYISTGADLFAWESMTFMQGYSRSFQLPYGHGLMEGKHRELVLYIVLQQFWHCICTLSLQIKSHLVLRRILNRIWSVEPYTLCTYYQKKSWKSNVAQSLFIFNKIFKKVH